VVDIQVKAICFDIGHHVITPDHSYYGDQETILVYPCREDDEFVTVAVKGPISGNIDLHAFQTADMGFADPNTGEYRPYRELVGIVQGALSEIQP
jgi:hypothetical protein